MSADVTEDDLRWWLDLAPTLTWINARTYQQTAPHEYVVLGRTEGLTKEDFVRAAKVIRTFGEPGKFWQRTNLYLTHAGVKYWTMDERVEDTDLINRADAGRTYGRQDAPSTDSGQPFGLYDEIAQRYDAIWTRPSDQEEHEQVRKLIAAHFGATAPTTLDVGCGTGLLLDLKITAPSLYTGIDPSQGMLNELVRKHPR